MQLLTNEKVVNIMENTLNHVDARLIDHGKRVAYMMYKLLAPRYRFDERRLRDICILAMLHDVGAYKTEEIDKMMIFETVDIWAHSIYGYLFLKYFSPLKDLAPVVLFHHAECDKITSLDSEHQLLAQLISLCDRADIHLLYKANMRGFRNHVEKYRDIKYRGDIVDMFLESGMDISGIHEDIGRDEGFNRVFHNTQMTGAEVDGYIEMIIRSIDFRSSQTVIHSVAVAAAAVSLAGLTGADESGIRKIGTGAMLHDIGKIGIPVRILENSGRLNAGDMEIMKTHVVISEEILDGNVDEDVKLIAVRHHEKLDGTGYPR